MRYRIANSREVCSIDGFQPYEVTLKVDNITDARIMHDHVAARMAQSGKFIGSVYRAKSGLDRPVEGQVIFQPGVTQDGGQYQLIGGESLGDERYTQQLLTNGTVVIPVETLLESQLKAEELEQEVYRLGGLLQEVNALYTLEGILDELIQTKESSLQVPREGNLKETQIFRILSEETRTQLIYRQLRFHIVKTPEAACILTLQP